MSQYKLTISILVICFEPNGKDQCTRP